MRTLIMLLGTVAVLNACHQETEYRIIEISGVDAAFNISRAPYFGSFTGRDSLLPMAVAHKDLLFVMDETFDRVVYFRYHGDMGTQIELRFDTVNTAAFYLNGKLHSIDMTMEEKALELLSDTSPSGLEGVESVYLDLPVEEDVLEQMRSVFPPHHRLNMILEGADSLNQLDLLFRRFRPRWVYMADLDRDYGYIDWLTGLQDLELLGTGISSSESEPFFTGLFKLEELILSADQEKPFPDLSLKALKHLRSVSILDAGPVNLDFLKNAPGLRNLYILNADSVYHAEALDGMKQLEGLGFTECELHQDLPVLPGLRWMALPENMTQEAFSDWCNNHPEVRVLEANRDTLINDLTPLYRLPRLRGLLLGLPEADLSALEKMENLEMLVIEQNIYDQSPDQIDRLKEALPGARIVPGGGFCLGSGWILLLLPLAGTGWILSAWMRKKKKSRAE
ncbi:MAG TPA: hypothetical protein ENN63_02710 [Bacteroidetes bacterium]|nr:hypothetical protein [Bacteroidota bacterium]